jgi:hypothetical protein
MRSSADAHPRGPSIAGVSERQHHRVQPTRQDSGDFPRRDTIQCVPGRERPCQPAGVRLTLTGGRPLRRLAPTPEGAPSVVADALACNWGGAGRGAIPRMPVYNQLKAAWIETTGG